LWELRSTALSTTLTKALTTITAINLNISWEFMNNFRY